MNESESSAALGRVLCKVRFRWFMALSFAGAGHAIDGCEVGLRAYQLAERRERAMDPDGDGHPEMRHRRRIAPGRLDRSEDRPVFDVLYEDEKGAASAEASFAETPVRLPPPHPACDFEGRSYRLRSWRRCDEGQERVKSIPRGSGSRSRRWARSRSARRAPWPRPETDNPRRLSGLRRSEAACRSMKAR